MPTSYRCNLHPHGKTKDGKSIDTKLHYQYICREGKYQNIRNHGEDLQHKSSGNIPSWAKESASNFWEEAEKNRLKQNYHDRQEARAYREFELTLQMELSLDDNIEKDRPLPTPEDFFKRYSKNKQGEPVGGYKKDRRFHDRPFLIDARKIWADIINEKLKEDGIEERVSHETLKKQQADLYNKGDYENGDLLNREPAPKMDEIYRNPKMIEEIEAKIKQYELSIPDKKPLKEMSFIEKNISLYAKDIVLRRAARQIQWNRKKRDEKFIKDRTEEEIKNILESPAVVTVRDIQEYLEEKIKEEQEQIKKNNEQYRETKKGIAKEEWYHSMTLQRMAGNEYQRRRKAYAVAEQKYKDEEAKDDTMLDPSIPNFQEKYMYYLINLRKLKTDAEQKRDSFENLKRDCMERKDEYKKILEEIKKENEQKQKEAKAILFSEPLPKQLTRNNKINGTIPVKKLKACAYKGSIYYIIEGEKESVKGIRIGDDIIEGQVPIYAIERKEEDGRYHITKVKPTEEKQFLYKNRNTETPDGLKKYEPKETPAIIKARAQQEQRQRNTLANTLNKMMESRETLIRLRWNEKENKETNAMEEAEKK